MAPRKRWGGIAALWGLLFGVLAAMLAVLDRIFTARAAAPRAGLALLPGGGLVRIALVAVGLLFFFLAGVFAARAARLVEPGIVAGLLAGLVVGLTAIALTLLAIGDIQSSVPRRLAASRALHVLEGGAIVRALVILILAALVGAGLGALGGLAGRGRPVPPAAYPSATPPPSPAAPHTGGPAMPQPSYTPPPGYPDPGQTSHASYAVPPVSSSGSLPDAPTIVPTPPPGA